MWFYVAMIPAALASRELTRRRVDKFYEQMWR